MWEAQGGLGGHGWRQHAGEGAGKAFQGLERQALAKKFQVLESSMTVTLDYQTQSKVKDQRQRAKKSKAWTFTGTPSQTQSQT